MGQILKTANQMTRPVLRFLFYRLLTQNNMQGQFFPDKQELCRQFLLQLHWYLFFQRLHLHMPDLPEYLSGHSRILHVFLCLQLRNFSLQSPELYELRAPSLKAFRMEQPLLNIFQEVCH